MKMIIDRHATFLRDAELSIVYELITGIKNNDIIIPKNSSSFEFNIGFGSFNIGFESIDSKSYISINYDEDAPEAGIYITVNSPSDDEKDLEYSFIVDSPNDGNFYYKLEDTADYKIIENAINNIIESMPTTNIPILDKTVYEKMGIYDIIRDSAIINKLDITNKYYGRISMHKSIGFNDGEKELDISINISNFSKNNDKRYKFEESLFELNKDADLFDYVKKIRKDDIYYIIMRNAIYPISKLYDKENLILYIVSITSDYTLFYQYYSNTDKLVVYIENMNEIIKSVFIRNKFCEMESFHKIK